MSLAPSALVQLDSACELFFQGRAGLPCPEGTRESGSTTKSPVHIDVPVQAIMLRLQEKAHMSLDDFRKGVSPPMRQGSISDPTTPVDPDDELATLGGQTRLVAKKEPTSPQLAQRSPPFQPVVPLPLRHGTDDPVHPSVIEYLQTFTPPPVPVVVGNGFADTTMFDLPAFTDPGVLYQCSL